MSLWRVKHTLSPFVEYALVSLTAAYGLLAIYFVSIHPLAVSVLSPSTSLPTPVALDIDAWTRHDNVAFGYAYAAPAGWSVVDVDPARVRLGRSAKEIGLAPTEGGGLMAEVVALSPRQRIENVAALDFAGSRPALYDVSVDGRESLFVTAFENGHVRRQAVYIPLADDALVIRAASLDPSVFSAFISTIKFFSPEP